MKAPDRPIVSKGVAPTVFAVGVIAIFVVTAMQIFQLALFPTSLDERWVLTASAQGQNRNAVTTKLDKLQREAMAFLNQHGFGSRDVTIDQAEIQYDQGSRSFEGLQHVSVHATDYPRFARLTNIFQREKLQDLWSSYPSMPFLGLVLTTWIMTVLLLCVSAGAIETREAEIARAPRGMHPVMVASQILALGALGSLATAYSHVLVDVVRLPFILTIAIGTVSLGAWLVLSWKYWGQNIALRYARGFVIAGIVSVLVLSLLALQVPLT